MQHQVVTALLISENEETVQRFLKRINSNKLTDHEKTINLYYKQIDLNNDHKCLQQLSMFEYAILFLKDLEFHQFTMDNYNFRMLKLLQFYNYKQVFIVYDENDNNSSNAQLQNLHAWIYQEVYSIFNDERQNEQQESNILGFSIPGFTTQSQPTQNDFLNFFKNNEDIANSDLVISLMNETDVNKGIAQVINGFILNGQTVLYQEQGALQKVQITNFVDYFSKKEINFAQKGDIIEFQFGLNKKIDGLLFGLKQDKYLLQIKEIKGNFFCPGNVGQGGIQKIQKADSKAFFYGIEFQLEKKKIIGQLVEKAYVEMKTITTKPFGMSFRFTKQLYLTKQILDKNFTLLVIKNKNLPQSIIFSGKILNQDLINITKVQVQIQKVVLIPELTSPPLEFMVNNGVDYRQRCRVCRTEKARYVPTNCGHLRYCNDCKDICTEAKQCLYCDKPSANTQSFNIHLTKQQLQSLKSMTEKQFIEYFAGNPAKDLLPFMKIYNEINVEQNMLYEVKCDNCDSRITQYSVCSNNHQTLLCDECQIQECQICKDILQIKQKIIYIFPDDPTV